MCEDEEKAMEVYGKDVSQKLRSRLADFLAAKNVNELCVGSPTQITYTSFPAYRVDLVDNYRLIFCSNHIKPVLLDTGLVDWSNVTYIKILAIETNYE